MNTRDPWPLVPYGTLSSFPTSIPGMCQSDQEFVRYRYEMPVLCVTCLGLDMQTLMSELSIHLYYGFDQLYFSHSHSHRQQFGRLTDESVLVVRAAYPSLGADNIVVFSYPKCILATVATTSPDLFQLVSLLTATSLMRAVGAPSMSFPLPAMQSNDNPSTFHISHLFSLPIST